jgi:hypothetical protein
MRMRSLIAMLFCVIPFYPGPARAQSCDFFQNLIGCDDPQLFLTKRTLPAPKTFNRFQLDHGGGYGVLSYSITATGSRSKQSFLANLAAIFAPLLSSGKQSFIVTLEASDSPMQGAAKVIGRKIVAAITTERSSRKTTAVFDTEGDLTPWMILYNSQVKVSLKVYASNTQRLNFSILKSTASAIGVVSGQKLVVGALEATKAFDLAEGEFNKLLALYDLESEKTDSGSFSYLDDKTGGYQFAVASSVKGLNQIGVNVTKRLERSIFSKSENCGRRAEGDEKDCSVVSLQNFDHNRMISLVRVSPTQNVEEFLRRGSTNDVQEA